ncbi:hypothetical protein N825_13320 [Skermanella stibiiresistens SB22]|uniref:Histidine kinase n=1 Tax=Skermanella stibiiresistens SB22 TaxID=1385369 RepID=W9H175_9PROT|nr:FIST N-terminal domain-containing protein [Skermanella stibiiresistens]EWY38462.1 hypothetical protein N825_13320 [Skermanella stibiiresistens SB22]
MRVKQLAWTPKQGWEVSTPSDNLDSADFVLYFFSPGLNGGLDGLTARLSELAARFPGAPLVGCSTGGEILGDEVFDDSLVAAAIEFESTTVQIAKVRIGADTSHEVGRRLAAEFAADGLRALFVLSDGTGINGSDLIRGLQDVLGGDITITGGLAGDGADFKITHVGAGDAPETGRVAAIGFYGEAVTIGHGSYGGWQPFGPERRITGSNGNVLHTLDNQPALDLYKRYLGDQAEGLPGTALLFPLRIVRPDGGEVVRTIVGTDDATNTMVFAGDLPEGSVAQLMRASFEKLIDGAGEAATIASGEGGAPEGTHLAILVSCIGRKLVLGQRASEEVESVVDVLGDDARTIGFYSYGEISPQARTGTCELHNQTMTITTIGER